MNVRSKIALVSLFAMLFGSLVGCDRPEPFEAEEGEVAARNFLFSLRVRNLELAWEFLVEEDRKFLQARADEASKLGGDALDIEPWSVLNPRLVPASYFDVVKIELEDGTSDAEGGEPVDALITLRDASQFRLMMIKGDGRWFVDLPLGER